MQCLKETLPTLNLTPMELKLTMDGADLPDDVSAEDIFLDDSQLALIEKINRTITDGITHNNDSDDDSHISPVDCKYYAIYTFAKQKFNSKKHIHSIDLHITELHKS